jgi:hypothetical protein
MPLAAVLEALVGHAGLWWADGWGKRSRATPPRDVANTQKKRSNIDAKSWDKSAW